MQLIKTDKGIQTRTVTRVVKGKRVRVQEPLAPGYCLALINGGINVVKVGS